MALRHGLKPASTHEKRHFRLIHKQYLLSILICPQLKQMEKYASEIVI